MFQKYKTQFSRFVLLIIALLIKAWKKIFIHSMYQSNIEKNKPHQLIKLINQLIDLCLLKEINNGLK